MAPNGSLLGLAKFLSWKFYFVLGRSSEQFVACCSTSIFPMNSEAREIGECMPKAMENSTKDPIQRATQTDGETYHSAETHDEL